MSDGFDSIEVNRSAGACAVACSCKRSKRIRAGSGCTTFIVQPRTASLMCSRLSAGLCFGED